MWWGGQGILHHSPPSALGNISSTAPSPLQFEALVGSLALNGTPWALQQELFLPVLSSASIVEAASCYSSSLIWGTPPDIVLSTLSAAL